jgi:hypothetical protein
MRSQITFLQVFQLKGILKAVHVAMHGLFFEKTSCGKKILQCPSHYTTIFRHVVKNYASTSVKRGVGGV